MKIKRQTFAMVIGMLVILFVVFKSFFIPGPLSMGDAPFFTDSLLQSYLKIPTIWTYQGSGFGRINDIIWISPVLFIVGLLHNLAGFSHDTLIRIVFYFPAALGAMFGSMLVASYFKLSSKARFITSLIYTFNTFFILIVDGGQVGVALAYGIFPICFWAILSFLENATVDKFFLALLLVFIQTVTDIRISGVAVASAVSLFIVRAIIERKTIIKPLIFFIFVLILNIGLNIFWIFPFLTSALSYSESFIPQLELMSLLNSVTLFQPHWPNNIFGKVSAPPFYFLGVTFLILISVARKKLSKLTLSVSVCFILFAFLAKGTTFPAGSLYQFLVEKVPFGFAFRDSSKFMFPAILFIGLLIGSWVSSQKRKIVLVGVVVYLLFLIHPAILGRLNFVLSGQERDSLVYQYSDILEKTGGFFRAAWFPERHAQSVSTTDAISFDAKELADLRPFGRMNGGNSDRFNFVNNKDYLDWFRLFGIKYLFLSGNPRIKSLPEEYKRDWDALNQLVIEDKRLSKIAEGAYQVPQPLPHLFSNQNAVGIVGSDDIYEKLKNEIPNFFPGNLPMIFFEDGLVDISSLENLGKSNFSIYFNQKDKLDLVMTGFKNNFLSPSSASEWAMYKYSDYLKYKFELLIRNITYQEFDYSKGISFSTVVGEKLYFPLNVLADGKYTLAIRFLSDHKGGRVILRTPNWSQMIISDNENNFGWYFFEVDLKKGESKLEIENSGGINVINTAVLLPNNDFVDMQQRVNKYLSDIKTIDFEDLKNLASKGKWESFEPESKLPWVVLTDNYSPDWQMGGQSSIPVYSSVNLFYLPQVDSQNNKIEFTKQQSVEKALYFSLASAIFIIAIYAYLKLRHK